MGNKASRLLRFRRRDWIRTSDLYYPKVVRYRAALHAEGSAKLQVSIRTAIDIVSLVSAFSRASSKKAYLPDEEELCLSLNMMMDDVGVFCSSQMLSSSQLFTLFYHNFIGNKAGAVPMLSP